MARSVNIGSSAKVLVDEHPAWFLSETDLRGRRAGLPYTRGYGPTLSTAPTEATNHDHFSVNGGTSLLSLPIGRHTSDRFQWIRITCLSPDRLLSKTSTGHRIESCCISPRTLGQHYGHGVSDPFSTEPALHLISPQTSGRYPIPLISFCSE